MTYPVVFKLDGSMADDPKAYIEANYGTAFGWQRVEADEGEKVFRLTAFKEWDGGSATVGLLPRRQDRATAGRPEDGAVVAGRTRTARNPGE